jgi:hypothetical protein
MMVLVALAAHGSADAEEVAGWLGLPVTLVEALCAELEEAGQLTLARGHGVSSPPVPSTCRRAGGEGSEKLRGAAGGMVRALPRSPLGGIPGSSVTVRTR